LPTARAFAGAAAVGSLAYIVGGYDGKQELSEVLSYDPANPETPWTLRSPSSAPRAGLGLTALGSRLYAVGGWSPSLSYNEQYDTKLDAWSKIGTPRGGTWRNLGLVALGTDLYAVGGWSGSYLATNEKYQALMRLLLPGVKSGS
jgi:hypothetical protein